MNLADRKIRVMVVDDSTVVRRLLADILSKEPTIEVIGHASNGRIALQKLTQLSPDLMILDVEMPEMDGLETLNALREDYPNLPVIMFSTLTARGATITLDALAFGASDYVTKPANAGSMMAAIVSIREQLIPKIREICMKSSGELSSPCKRSTPAPKMRRGDATKRRFDAVLIGASTGGPQAVTSMLEKLPSEFPLPVAVVQHMPPVFTKYFAQRLNETCSLPVQEAQDGEPFLPGNVYIAPGDWHMELVREGSQTICKLVQTPPENSCRPAVDVLFRSAAKLDGKTCLGVVLTGMGHDGLRGCESIVRSGGTVLAQDKETSVVWGMPRAIVEADLAESVLPLPEMAPEILRLVGMNRIPTLAC